MTPVERIDDPIAVGLEQLDVAIDLFVQNISHISAITLAVAAENIFAQALKKKKPSQEDVLQWEFGLFDEMGLTPRGAKPKDRFSKFRQLKMTERDFANHGLDRQGRTAAKRP